MSAASPNKDSVVTVIFMLLAVAAIAVYFVLPERRMLFYGLGGAAVLLRVGQYLARLFAGIRMKRAKREELLRDLPPVTMNEKNPSGE